MTQFKHIFIKIVNKIRFTLLPSDFDKELKRYYAAGGDEAHRYQYELTPDSLVIDCGGYKGQWASEIYARYNCRILVFEPVRSFCQNIKNRFINNENISTYCFALGAKKREEFIALGDDGSSLFGSGEKELIAFENVVDFFAHENINSVDLMKINIEGGEFELLPKLLQSGIILKIKCLQIQFHDVEADSESRMNSIISELNITHKETYHYKFVWGNWVRRDS